METEEKTETMPAQYPADWDNDEAAVAVFDPNGGAPIASSDLVPPKLNLVQKTGDLSNDFEPGSFVLDKTVVLTESEGELFEFIMLAKPRKYFMERLPYDQNGPLPRIFKSEQEVKDAGLSLAWGPNNEPASAMPAADISMLITKPEKCSADGIGIEGFGASGVGIVASYLVARTAYSVAKRIYTSLTLNPPAGPLQGLLWTMMSEQVTNNKGSYYTPRVARLPRGLSDEVLERIRTIFTKPE